MRLTVIFVFAFFQLTAQDWVRQELKFNSHLTDCVFFGDTGTITEQTGYIFHTEDFFDSFWIDSSYKNQYGRCLIFPERNYGYISNSAVQGGLLRTFDGGVTWQSIGTGAPQGALIGPPIHFSSPGLGYYGHSTGSAGIKFTLDSGKVWTSSIISNDCSLVQRFVTRRDTLVYALCNSSTTGDAFGGWQYIYKTMDSGVSWQFHSMIPIRDFTDFHFLNDTDVILVGRRAIYRSSDAGLNFTNVMSSDSADTELVFPIKPIYFSSTNTGYVAFVKSIYKTTDSGHTWFRTSFKFHSFDSLHKINFIDGADANKIVVGTNLGAIYKTENGGGVWSGLNTIEALETFSLSPNPANNTLTIQTSATGPLMLFIYAIDGRLIKQLNNLQQANSSIDISDLQSGIYFIAVSAKGQQAVKRFIKQ